MNEFLRELRSLLVANHSEDVDSIIEYFEWTPTHSLSITRSV